MIPYIDRHSMGFYLDTCHGRRLFMS